MRRPLLVLSAAAIFLAVAHDADAQPASSGARHDEAVKAFLDGKKERDEHGCTKAAVDLFEKSAGYEPSIGAHYNLGICYEKTNKRAAYANYERALALAKDKQDDREREIAAQRYAFLKANPPVRLALPQPLPPDTRVTVDGDPVPQEDLQGETIYFPKLDHDQYDVRVTAPGYDDVHVTIDKSATQKNSLFTVTMRKHQESRPVGPAPRAVETQWGPFQFLGLGLIALGTTGVAYAAISYADYSSEESNLKKQFDDAEAAARGCASSSPPESTCGKNIATREDLRFRYESNEASAKRRRPVLLTAGIGGVLAIIGGVALIVFGPKTEVEPGTNAKTKPTFRVLPTYSPYEQGLSVVGTF